MIPRSSTSNPNATSSNAKGDSENFHPLFHLHNPSPDELRTHYSVIDLTGSNFETSNGRPTKRQRIDSKAPKRDEMVGRTTHTLPNTFGISATTSAAEIKPLWSFQNRVAPIETPDVLATGDQTVTGNKAEFDSYTLLPIRPWKYNPQGYARTWSPPQEADADDSIDGGVQTKPYHIEIPAVAPDLIGDKTSDFYPWAGSHPEDVLTEQTAKQGFYDRIQVSQNESNTARPSLYVQLKHRSGLKVLSSAFTLAVERRQNHCKISENSTFKPPPRVTLTDIKREAWLRDLSNPTVPLRKLSRTIPHGIRGKVLLDHCLNKRIPIGRAVWLAKCVGANEIRAFRRKGTSATVGNGLEVKWVRDWTVGVEQFVEAVIGSYCILGWESNLSYALRLSARLFHDFLLDRDLFLDWFLSSMSAAAFDTLPLWLSMIEVFWKDFVQYRRRGRCLAELLLEKLRLASTAYDPALLSPITRKLASLIKEFTRSQPSCFILPQTWGKYEDILASCFHLNANEGEELLQHLFQRNARVNRTRPIYKNGQQSTLQQLICLLDSICKPYDLYALSSECLDLPLAHETLIRKILEWASTPFRQGLPRLYVAVRLLRHWRRSYIDTDSHIFAFLEEHNRQTDFSIGNIYHVVCELIRSQSFSVGRYLQWLMARGAVDSTGPPNPSSLRSDVELLSHIPPRPVPDYVWNLRNALRMKTGFSVDAESHQISLIKAFLHQRLPDVFEGPFTVDHLGTGHQINFSNLTWSVKSEISQWILDCVTLRVNRAQRSALKNDNASHVVISFTPRQFFEIRNIIEDMGDLTILADILKHTSTLDDVAILTSAVDTIIYNFEAFRAIGSLVDLFNCFMATYTKIGQANYAVLELTSSLVEVAIKLPTEHSAVSILRRGLARFDRKPAEAISSPLSDHMPETLNATNQSCSETLQQFLASDSTMDRATMARIFGVLTRELYKEDFHPSGHQSARYLAQLRTLNQSVFDGLMVKWIASILESPSRPKITAFLPSLIGVGCITFASFFEFVNGLTRADTHRKVVHNGWELLVEMLHLLCQNPTNTTIFMDPILYRFKIARQEYMSQHVNDSLGLVHEILSETENRDGKPSIDCLRSLNTWEPLILPLLCELIVRNLNASCGECTGSLLKIFPACTDILNEGLGVLLGSGGQGLTTMQDMQMTLQSINDFSLPFCLMKLQTLFKPELDGDMRNDLADLVFKIVESDALDGGSRWVELLAALPLSAKQQTMQRAEQELLDLIVPTTADQRTLPDDNKMGPSSQKTGITYLQIIEALSKAIDDYDLQSTIGSILVEKMAALLQKTLTTANDLNDVDISNGPSTDCAIGGGMTPESMIGFSFYLLLRLVSIHRLSLSTGSSSKSDLMDQTRLLIQISCIALSPMFTSLLDEDFNFLFPSIIANGALQQTLPRTWASLQLHALDVCSGLVDTLPEETMQQCIRFFRDRCPQYLSPRTDPRLLFLFGPVTDTQLPGHQPVVSNLVSGPGVSLTTQMQPSSSQSPTSTAFTTTEVPSSFAPILRLQQGGRNVGPYPLRTWEMLEESAPVMNVNDTPISLSYFGTRQAKHQ